MLDLTRPELNRFSVLETVIIAAAAERAPSQLHHSLGHGYSGAVSNAELILRRTDERWPADMR